MSKSKIGKEKLNNLIIRLLVDEKLNMLGIEHPCHMVSLLASLYEKYVENENASGKVENVRNLEQKHSTDDEDSNTVTGGVYTPVETYEELAALKKVSIIGELKHLEKIPDKYLHVDCRKVIDMYIAGFMDIRELFIALQMCT